MEEDFWPCLLQKFQSKHNFSLRASNCERTWAPTHHNSNCFVCGTLVSTMTKLNFFLSPPAKRVSHCFLPPHWLSKDAFWGSRIPGFSQISDFINRQFCGSRIILQAVPLSRASKASRKRVIGMRWETVNSESFCSFLLTIVNLLQSNHDTRRPESK